MISASVNVEPRIDSARRFEVSRTAHIAIATLTVIGLLLRFWDLGAESLWLDEGISATFSASPLPVLFQTLIERDLHPPLYYLILHGWMWIAGATEYAVRVPTALFGTAMIPLVYRLSRDLYSHQPRGNAIALFAATQIAVSPFLVYYSREARMYGPLVALSTLATICLWRAVARPERSGRWVAYVVSAALVPYTHHFGWLVLLTHGVFVFAVGGRVAIRPFAVALIGVGLSYTPWVWPSILQITRLRNTPDFWQGAVSLWFVVSHAFTGIAVGFGGAIDRQGPVQILFVSAFGIGLALVSWRALRRRERADTLVVLSIVIPVLVIYALVANNPKFADRYLIVAVPGFSIMIARGIGAIMGPTRGTGVPRAGIRVARPALGTALALAIIIVTARETQRVFTDDAYRKDQNRHAVDFLIGNWQEGDAAILLIDWSPVFDYYAHGLLTRYGFGPTDDTQFIARNLNEIIDRGHGRLWVAFWNPEWADPTGTIREMLDETLTAMPFRDPRPRGLTLRLYRVEEGTRFDGADAPSRSEPRTYEGGLELLGFDLPADIAVVDGDIVRGRAYWRLAQSTDRDLGLAVRLVGGGHEWSSADQRLAAFTHPTTAWRPTRIVRGRFDIAIPPGVPPGEYDIQARVYDRRDGRELIQSGATSPRPARIARVAVARRSPPSVVPAFGDCPSAGVDFLTLICDAGFPARARPGDRVTPTLSWSRNRMVPVLDERARIGYRDGAGIYWSLSTETPGTSRFPPSAWATNDVVLDRRVMRLPARVASGAGSFVVAVTNTEISLGATTIEPIARVTVAPVADGAFRFRFGSFAALAAVDVTETVRSSGTVRARLIWRVLADTSDDARMFVHVADEVGRPVAQVDRTPGGGERPTPGWVEGEYVFDDVEVPLGTAVAPGIYRIRIGLYDMTNEQRLSVTTSAGLMSDVAEIGVVRVTP
ncbi:MAG: hypothetical protein EPO26_16125 [Chloroflexota bacterium]|nr:MAG: hypothetical protein EPO26_16125 [Chloroflexota bacterium]